jgi:hypothetical protein
MRRPNLTCGDEDKAVHNSQQPLIMSSEGMAGLSVTLGGAIGSFARSITSWPGRRTLANAITPPFTRPPVSPSLPPSL